ncbi:MAG TPA: hypothetical protein PKD12_08095 [Nitrospira sp.]|nr:hypothetical protein [Nitrospira sp.]
MAKLSEEAVEVVAELADEVSEQAAVFAEAARNMTAVKLQFAGLGIVVGAVTGAFVAFRLAYRKAEAEFIEEVEGQVAEAVKEMQSHFAAKERALENREKPDLADVVQELGYSPTPEEAEVVNAFDKDEPQPEPADTWNYEQEVASRGAVYPYVIHHDEYVINEDEHEQVTLTYYSGDDVLADERDQVMPDREAVVGLENLEKFGHGSEDPNVVYVCNPRLEVDYEVVRSEGKFATEVHGFSDDELSHSVGRRRRRRFDDETST